MDSIQIAGYATDSYDLINNWYSSRTDFPFPFASKYGLNSGVVAMNLTRMRQVGYLDEIKTIADKWGDKITFFDQDLINLYFYDHPERYLLLPCRFNYLTFHCLAGNKMCESAEKESIIVLHGLNKVFRENSTLPTFQWVYQAFKNYELGTDLDKNLLETLKHKLNPLKNTKTKTYCSSTLIKSLN